jgi:hypothetical protein
VATDAELKAAHDRGATYREIATEYGLSRNSVRGRVGRARRAGQGGKVIFTIERRDKSMDADRWQDTLSDMRRRRYVTVVHMSDLHFPFHDPAALALAYQVIRYLDPDCIVTLSDGYDFAQISPFAPDPDLPAADVLENVQPHWWQHIDTLKVSARRAVIRAILGNHDYRLQRFLAETAPQIRTTMLHAFDDLVRYREQVLMPDYLSEVDIGVLTVMHGNKSTLGIYGAKRQLEARRFQRFVMSGHAHVPGFHMTRGPEHVAASIVNGCHCLPAHYHKDTLFNTWVLGLGYAVVDMQAGYAWLHNVVYEPIGDRLVTAIGNQIFSAPVAATERQAAA